MQKLGGRSAEAAVSCADLVKAGAYTRPSLCRQGSVATHPLMRKNGASLQYSLRCCRGAVLRTCAGSLVSRLFQNPTPSVGVEAVQACCSSSSEHAADGVKKWFGPLVAWSGLKFDMQSRFLHAGAEPAPREWSSNTW